MDNIIMLNEDFVIAQTSIIRNKDSSPSQLQKSLFLLGQEIGKKIVEKYYLCKEDIVTPMNQALNSLLPKVPLSIIITTKDDLEYMGKGIASVLENCELGYMDFEGRRGLQALNSPIRYIELPELSNKAVDSLIVAKAVLATGCTAISLTKTALSKFFPKRLIIATIFYSKKGLSDLLEEFPHADIFVVGQPDEINEDGMLVPGIGNLDQRLKE